ncbi:hypothetical protein C8F01DRAFT_1085614 [Mycena amicta]|nr:hypothetical protein C8F01DRAFT_1085614 [Mycena amicta]
MYRVHLVPSQSKPEGKDEGSRGEGRSAIALSFPPSLRLCGFYLFCPSLAYCHGHEIRLLARGSYTVASFTLDLVPEVQCSSARHSLFLLAIYSENINSSSGAAHLRWTQPSMCRYTKLTPYEKRPEIALKARVCAGKGRRGNSRDGTSFVCQLSDLIPPLPILRRRPPLVARNPHGRVSVFPPQIMKDVFESSTSHLASGSPRRSILWAVAAALGAYCNIILSLSGHGVGVGARLLAYQATHPSLDIMITSEFEFAGPAKSEVIVVSYASNSLISSCEQITITMPSRRCLSHWPSSSDCREDNTITQFFLGSTGRRHTIEVPYVFWRSVSPTNAALGTPPKDIFSLSTNARSDGTRGIYHKGGLDDEDEERMNKIPLELGFGGEAGMPV